MKIVHVVASLSPEIGGPAHVCHEFARRMAAAGHDVSVVTTTGRSSRAVPGATVRQFRALPPRRLGIAPAMMPAVGSMVAGADVVHLHSVYRYPSLVAARACRRAGIPYVVSVYGALSPYLRQKKSGRKTAFERLAGRSVLTGARAVRVASERERSQAEAFAVQLGIEFPMVVIPNGIDVTDAGRAPAQPAEAIWPELAGRRVVLFLGRLAEEKGLDVLARAFGLLRRERDDVHLVLAGPSKGDYIRQVRRWFDDQAPDRVTFAGLVSGDVKQAALHRADLLVLPSYTESFGNVVLEALACGTPVVLSEGVALAGEVHAAHAGEVLDWEPARWASTVSRLLDDDDERAAMGARGRALVEERYGWDAATAQMLATYEGIRSGTGAP